MTGRRALVNDARRPRRRTGGSGPSWRPPGILPGLALLSSLVVASGGEALQARPGGDPSLPSIAEFTRGLERNDGYIPFYYRPSTGQLFLEACRWEEEFLHLTSLATGIGWGVNWSLDRGTIGSRELARFERHGPAVMLVQVPTAFRALEARNREEALSVEESFPTSVVGAFRVVAEERGCALADATDYLLDDAFGVRSRVRSAGQGDFRVVRDRSAIHLPRTKAFPKNTEIEVSITFTSDQPGPQIARHAPDGRSFTLRQHQSFVELPPDGYRPRRFDPRVGVGAVTVMDFSRHPEEGHLEERWIRRWRLEKRDPSSAMSEPVEPIVYYLDRGIPEPYRTAFREGTLWWNQVLEAAGFRNALQVRDLPDGVDPMDARYSVIQWVHRSDYGPSVGPSFHDPRTGEIIKAAVRMDSHRSLTNFNTFATLAAASSPAAVGGSSGGDGANGFDGWLAGMDPGISAEDYLMIRRRQHVAHEVGHTLGFAHNFITASYGRGSVMDNPTPVVRVRPDGSLDLTSAYREGPGSYDSLAVRYAYTQFDSPAAEHEGLEAILQEGARDGIRFITGRDASPAGAIPIANEWIYGQNMVDELERVMGIRRTLLDRFNESAIQVGEPMWFLNQRLVPAYHFHRYTLEGAIKTVGGMDYNYTVRGDGQAPPAILSPAEQRRALRVLAAAVHPEELEIPERVIRLMAPVPYGYSEHPRTFRSTAGPAFDPLDAARGLARHVIEGILHPERAPRLVIFHARNPDAPSLHEVIDELVQATWGVAPGAGSMRAALARVSQRTLVDALFGLAVDPRSSVDTRVAAEWQLRRLLDRVEATTASAPDGEAHRAVVLADIERYLETGEVPRRGTATFDAPLEYPIG
jgi:hypothetical protein